MHRAVLASAASLFALCRGDSRLLRRTSAAAAAPPAAADGRQRDRASPRSCASSGSVDVPMAITAYNGEFLDELGLNDFEDLSRFVPGFEVQNQSPNNPGFVMRGVTSDSGERVQRAARLGLPGRRLHLQVARLLRRTVRRAAGRGRARPAIDALRPRRADRRGQHHPEPRRPSGFARACSEARLRQFQRLDVEGMVNVPLGDNAAFRVAGRYRNARRLHRESARRRRFQFGRHRRDPRHPALARRPSRLTVDIFGNYQEDHPHGTSFKSMSFNPTDPVTGAVLGNRDPEHRRGAGARRRLRGRRAARARPQRLGPDRPRPRRTVDEFHAHLDQRLSRVQRHRDPRRGRHLAAGDHRGRGRARQPVQPGIPAHLRQSRLDHRLPRRLLFQRERRAAHAGPVRRARAARAASPARSTAAA